MKINEINSSIDETMLSGNLEDNSNKTFNNLAKHLNEYSSVGNIDGEYNVVKWSDGTNSNYFLLNSQDAPIALYVVVKISNSRILLKVMHVIPLYRKKSITARFIWFLKREEHFKEIQIGNIISPDTKHLINRLSHSFHVWWESEDEKIKYTDADFNKYSSQYKPTEWNIVLENDHNFTNLGTYTNVYDLWSYFGNFLNEGECD